MVKTGIVIGETSKSGIRDGEKDNFRGETATQSGPTEQRASLREQPLAWFWVLPFPQIEGLSGVDCQAPLLAAEAYDNL